MSRASFFVVTFTDSDGMQQCSSPCETIRLARRMAAHYATFATGVRIMQGGAGGMVVQ